MAQTGLRREELLGLALALTAHAGLVALLVASPPRPPLAPLPDRIAVTISTDVGLTSTSPRPEAEAAPDIAPQVGDPAPDVAQPAEPLQQPLPEPVPAPPPKPAAAPPPPRPAAAPPPPKPAVSPPRPRPAPAPPAPRRTEAKPASRPAPAARPAPKPASKPAARPAANSATTPPARSGGSRVGNDFLKGVPGAQAAGNAQAAPAAAIGPAVRASLASAISRQLKPRWSAPQGVDAELLVTVLSFSLKPDGSLDGSPQVVRQDGLTDANRAQAARHAEQAIRAVQLAAPFDLPAQYYEAWKRVSAFRFDRRLSQ